MRRRDRRVLRTVAGAWLFGWFVNAPGKPGFLDNFVDALALPILHEGFPWLMRDPRLALAVYLLPALVLPALVWPTARRARAASALMVGCAAFLLMHLETGNDATFTTSFWVAAWLTWFSHLPARGRRRVALARGLAHGVIGLVFLGGLVGKLTPAYHDTGEAFFRIYFRDNRHFPYSAMREAWGIEGLSNAARWFSRLAVSAEAMLACAPILPTRAVLLVTGGTALAMMTMWTFHLASVLSCLIGLLVGVEVLAHRPERAT